MEEQQKNNAEEAPKTNNTQQDAKGIMNQLESLLDEYMVKKAPFSLPMGVKEFIVKISPYLIIIFAVLTIPIILAAIGISTIFAPLAMLGGQTWGFGVIISLVASAIALVMEVIAVPSLFKRAKSGWRMVFYASIVSLIGNIFSLGGIVGAIIGTIIGWYILFQVKDMYKN
jgi:hypothetical protein